MNTSLRVPPGCSQTVCSGGRQAERQPGVEGKPQFGGKRAGAQLLWAFDLPPIPCGALDKVLCPESQMFSSVR